MPDHQPNAAAQRGHSSPDPNTGDNLARIREYGLRLNCPGNVGTSTYTHEGELMCPGDATGTHRFPIRPQSADSPAPCLRLRRTSRGKGACAEKVGPRREHPPGQADDAADGFAEPDLLMPGRTLLRWAFAALEDPTLKAPSVPLLVDMIQRLRQHTARAPLCSGVLQELCGSPGDESIQLLTLTLIDAWLCACSGRSLW
jgi:hypothetical protein